MHLYGWGSGCRLSILFEGGLLPEGMYRVSAMSHFQAGVNSQNVFGVLDVNINRDRMIEITNGSSIFNNKLVIHYVNDWHESLFQIDYQIYNCSSVLSSNLSSLHRSDPWPGSADSNGYLHVLSRSHLPISDDQLFNNGLSWRLRHRNRHSYHCSGHETC